MRASHIYITMVLEIDDQFLQVSLSSSEKGGGAFVSSASRDTPDLLRAPIGRHKRDGLSISM